MDEAAVVLHEVKDSAFWITINRPDKRNAIHEGVVQGIQEGLRLAHANPQVRVIVLTGAGEKAFCAGGDLQPGKSFEFDFAKPNVAYADLLREAHSATLPLIARINGTCMAGGMGLLCMADFAVAADHALFGLPEVKRGLMAAAGGLFGQVLGVAIGAQVAASHGWRMSFAVIGLFGLALGVIYPLIVKERRLRALATGDPVGQDQAGDDIGADKPTAAEVAVTWSSLRALVGSQSIRLTYVASGVIRTDKVQQGNLPNRLKVIYDGIREINDRYQPDVASVEIVFVNINPQATLLLGQARGCCVTALVSCGLPVAEYTALQMKKAVVGHGLAAVSDTYEPVTNDDYATFTAHYGDTTGSLEVSRVAAGYPNNLNFEVFGAEGDVNGAGDAGAVGGEARLKHGDGGRAAGGLGERDCAGHGVGGVAQLAMLGHRRLGLEETIRRIADHFLVVVEN